MKISKQLEIAVKELSANLLRSMLSQPERSPAPPYNRILFIRYGGIGDMLLSLPVFRATRDKFPDAKIDVLCDQKNMGPLSGIEFINRIYIYDKRPLQVLRLLRTLRSKKYDYINNQVIYASFTFGLLARLIGPDAIRAAGDQQQYTYFYNRPVNLPPKREIHMLERLFLLAADLTAYDQTKLSTPWTDYGDFINKKAAQVYDHLLSDLKISGNRPRIALLNLSAGLARRQWPMEKNVQFLSAVLEKYDSEIDGWGILVHPQFPREAETLINTVGSAKVVLVPAQTDFRVMITLLRHVFVLVTPDTSFVHSASAMGTSVLDLIIGENTTTWDPYAVKHRLAISRDEKSLEGLEVEDALSAFDSLLHELIP